MTELLKLADQINKLGDAVADGRVTYGPNVTREVAVAAAYYEVASILRARAKEQGNG